MTTGQVEINWGAETSSWWAAVRCTEMTIIRRAAKRREKKITGKEYRGVKQGSSRALVQLQFKHPTAN